MSGEREGRELSWGGGADRLGPIQWIGSEYLADVCDLSGAEVKAYIARALKGLTVGKRPAPKIQGPPHSVFTLGGPGAGKSSVVRAVLARRHPGRDYVVLDPDRLLDYHPRARGGVIAVPDIEGRPTGLGLTHDFGRCLRVANAGVYDALEGSLTSKGYNLIVAAFGGQHRGLVEAKQRGRRTSLVFVGAPLEAQQARSWARARETGQFFKNTRAEHDVFVADLRAQAAADAPWFGLWADEFLVVDNGANLPALWGAGQGDLGAGAKGVPAAAEVPPRRGAFDGWLAAARGMVESACPPAGASGGARRVPAIRWVPVEVEKSCRLTEGEAEAAGARARKALTAGHRTAAERGTGAPPRSVYTMGAPGSGKSSVSQLLIRAPPFSAGADFISIDLDEAIKYHPRYRGVYLLPDLDGQATAAGLASAYHVYNQQMEEVVFPIINELGGAGYDLLLNQVGARGLRDGKRHGHLTTLLFVGAPVAVAQARVRSRAVETGRFLERSLAAQARRVADWWRGDLILAPWYALWADEFYVADNGAGQPGPAGAAEGATRVRPREEGETLGEWLWRAQQAVDRASGVGPAARKKESAAAVRGLGVASPA